MSMVIDWPWLTLNTGGVGAEDRTVVDDSLDDGDMKVFVGLVVWICDDCRSAVYEFVDEDCGP